MIAHYDASEDALAFANSVWAEQLCQLGTSCPDHFLRTRISPLYLRWKPEDGLAALKAQTLQADEIIIVDNASHDDSVAFLRACHPKVNVVELEDNRGFSGGNIAGYTRTMTIGNGTWTSTYDAAASTLTRTSLYLYDVPGGLRLRAT